MKLIKNNFIFKFFIFLLLISNLCTVNFALATTNDAIPDGFVVVSDVVPDVILEIRYYSTYNFVGKRVDGYHAPIAILTKETAAALKNASEDFKKLGYVIKIYDAYRPQSAVNHFVRWANDVNDNKMKNYFYPGVNKEDLFDLGYIGKKSAHSRGSALDMTIVDMKTGKEIDTGSPFDYFGDVSHYETNKITPEQKNNRDLIKKVMIKNGFDPYKNEWWHFTLHNEPFPNTYFNFPIENFKKVN